LDAFATRGSSGVSLDRSSRRTLVMTLNVSENAILSAQVPAELHDGLRRLAREHDRSISAEVRSAVRSHLQAAEDAGGPSPSPEYPAERRVPVDPAVEARALARETP
jgi:plasmid stability protein